MTSASNAALKDASGLALVVLLSAALYVGRLGFYSDDWSILAHYIVGGQDHSFAGLLGRAFDAHDIKPRPVYAVYITVLYQAFGLNPLGYHLVNSAVIAAGAVLLYLALRELGLSRLIAVAVPLVYALLPHYSTDRFWYISFHVPLSMATWCLSLYAGLRAARLPAGQGWPWRLLALASLVASLLIYEVFLPLFFLNPLLVWFRWRSLAAASRAPSRSILLMSLVQWLTIIVLALVKSQITERLPGVGVAEHFSWFANFLSQAAGTALLGAYGLRLPIVLAHIVRTQADPVILAGGLALGVAIAAWLLRVAEAGDGLERAGMRRLVACGAVVFVGGYSIFFIAFNTAVSTTGMNNRTAMAAALGLALVFVGAVGWACAWLADARWRRRVFCAAIALACASGFIVINSLALFWGAASERQRLVMQDLGPRLAGLPVGSMLMLDGVCPYVGPAPVFDSPWDFTGALHILSGGVTLTGDVVTPRMRVTDAGVTTRIYQFAYGPYPWKNFFVYNFARREIIPVQGPYAMLAYLQAYDPTRDGGCPPSREGEGEQVFSK